MAKSACPYKFDEGCVEIVFDGPISRKNDSSFLLNFKDHNNKHMVLEQLPNLKLWMVMSNGHEHGSEPVKITKKAAGFQVTNVWFLMRGRWLVKLDFKYKGNKRQMEIPICVGQTSQTSHVGECSK